MTDWQAFVNIILKQTLRKLDYQQKISHRHKKILFNYSDNLLKLIGFLFFQNIPMKKILCTLKPSLCRSNQFYLNRYFQNCIQSNSTLLQSIDLPTVFFFVWELRSSKNYFSFNYLHFPIIQTSFIVSFNCFYAWNSVLLKTWAT
jgi:hypothetical protein